MAYAIFKTGGKQYRVAAGDVIEVEKLDGEAGAEGTFSEVLFSGEGSSIKTGADLQGAKVVAENVGQFKGAERPNFQFLPPQGQSPSVRHPAKRTPLET